MKTRKTAFLALALDNEPLSQTGVENPSADAASR